MDKLLDVCIILPDTAKDTEILRIVSNAKNEIEKLGLKWGIKDSIIYSEDLEDWTAKIVFIVHYLSIDSTYLSDRASVPLYNHHL